MPLTEIDPVAALVVIDLQKGIASPPTAHPVEGVIAAAARLARGFRGRGLPVVLVNVAGKAPGRTDAKWSIPPAADWAELIPELDRQPSDYVITKEQYGAFEGTALDQILRRRGATQLFLAGIATSIGVESTARQAYDLGYHVVFVSDAMTDRVPEAHQNSVARIFPRLGEVTSTDEVLSRLRG